MRVRRLTSEADRPVDELVRVVLEALKDLLADDFAAVDEVVSTMMVVVRLSEPIIDLYQLPPVRVLDRGVVLYRLELVRESTTHLELVTAVTEL